MATGGSIVGFSYNGNNYPIPNDVFPTLKHAGWMNESNDHGDGGAHNKRTRTSWSASGLAVNVDAAGWQQLQADANEGEYLPTVVSLASGEVWQGNSLIVGDLNYETEHSNSTFDLGGNGDLTPQ